MRGPVVSYFSFIVEGRGEFPLDMLRYDECKVNGGLSDSTDRRQVTLLGPRQPTAARWLSFGWTVVVEQPHLGAMPIFADPSSDVPAGAEAAW